MKNAACKTVIALALVMLALDTANAQKTSATVNIPFSFTVDDVRMPGGTPGWPQSFRRPRQNKNWGCR